MEKAKTLLKSGKGAGAERPSISFDNYLFPGLCRGRRRREGGREGGIPARASAACEGEKERERERERSENSVEARRGKSPLSSWPAVGRYPPPEVQGSFLKAHRRRKGDPKTHTLQSKQRERT